MDPVMLPRKPMRLWSTLGSERHVRFVVSKTHVTPCQELTIPRLELLSASTLLGSNLPLGQPVCHTDSQVAQYWIVSHGKEWKQFVQNRVSEIRELLPISCWKHCPGADNPADIPSRGLTPIELSASKLWHCGPDWLLKATDDDLPATAEIPADCLAEMRLKDRETHSLLATTTIGLENVMDCGRYSSLSRLLSVTAYVMKFIRALKRAVQDSQSTSDTL